MSMVCCALQPQELLTESFLGPDPVGIGIRSLPIGFGIIVCGISHCSSHGVESTA